MSDPGKVYIPKYETVANADADGLVRLEHRCQRSIEILEETLGGLRRTQTIKRLELFERMRSTEKPLFAQEQRQLKAELDRIKGYIEAFERKESKVRDRMAQIHRLRNPEPKLL